MEQNYHPQVRAVCCLPLPHACLCLLTDTDTRVRTYLFLFFLTLTSEELFPPTWCRSRVINCEVSFAATHHMRIAPARPSTPQTDCTCHNTVHCTALSADLIAVTLSYVRTEHTATHVVQLAAFTASHKTSAHTHSHTHTHTQYEITCHTRVLLSHSFSTRRQEIPGLLIVCMCR